MKRLGLTVIGAALLAISLSATAGDRWEHERMRDSYRHGHFGGQLHKTPGWQRHYYGKHHHRAPRVEHHHHYYQRGPAYYPRSYRSHGYPSRGHAIPRHHGGVNGHVTIHF